MKPLILEYAEIPSKDKIDTSIIEYSTSENLNVIKGTVIPAIQAAQHNNEKYMSYMNFSKEQISNLKALLDTSTITLVSTEAVDSDNNKSALASLMDTQTLTEAVEPTDSDK